MIQGPTSRGTGPHRPEAQDVALSRPKHGFESRWGRHFGHLSACYPRQIDDTREQPLERDRALEGVAAAMRFVTGNLRGDRVDDRCQFGFNEGADLLAAQACGG